MTEPTDTAPEPTTEQWTCIGRRWSVRDKKILYIWSDAPGNELWYEKLDGIPGGVYAVTVDRSSSENVVVKNADGRRYIGPADWSADLRAAFQVKDRHALQQQQSHRLEKSDKRRNEIDVALEPILKIASRLRVPADREALLSYVTRAINRA